MIHQAEKFSHVRIPEGLVACLWKPWSRHGGLQETSTRRQWRPQKLHGTSWLQRTPPLPQRIAPSAAAQSPLLDHRKYTKPFSQRSSLKAYTGQTSLDWLWYIVSYDYIIRMIKGCIRCAWMCTMMQSASTCRLRTACGAQYNFEGVLSHMRSTVAGQLHRNVDLHWHNYGGDAHLGKKTHVLLVANTTPGVLWDLQHHRNLMETLETAARNMTKASPCTRRMCFYLWHSNGPEDFARPEIPSKNGGL